MTNFIANEEEVEQHGRPMRGKNTKKTIRRKALGISSSAFKNGDVDEIFHLVRLSTLKQ